MKIGHVDWLLNRIEELEIQLSINTNNMKQLQKRIEELEEREKLYKETIQSYGRLADGFIDDIESLVKRNEHYKQALELIYKDTFYESENDLVSPIHVIRKRTEKALKEKGAG